MALDNFKKTSMRIDKANQRFLDYQNAKVGDVNGRELLVQITNNGVVEDQTGTTLKLNWQHENGSQGSTSFNEVDIKTGKYSLYYPNEMLYKGTVDASVEINSNGQTTNTMNFKIIVHADVFNGEAGTVDGVFISLADVNKKLDDREKEYVELKNRQSNVENQFNDIQQEMTNNDVSSAPEIIAARGGEPTLGVRLDKEQQEVNAQLAQTAKMYSGLVKYGNVSIPDDFPNLPFNLFRGFDGIIRHDYDFTKHKYSQKIYLSESGNSSNDGLSPETPIRNWAEVIAKINTLPQNNINLVILDKFYSMLWFETSQIMSVRKNITISSVHENGTFIVSASGKGLWVEADGIHKVTRSQAQKVFFYDKLDIWGNPVEIKKVDSLLECQQELNTWYTDGTDVWINKEGMSVGKSQDVEIMIPYDLSLRFDFTHNTLVLDNIKFLIKHTEGKTPKHNALEVRGNINTKFIARKLSCKYSANNGLASINVGTCLIFDSSSQYNSVDGFNYHGNSSGLVFEYNCYASDNGTVAEGSANATTAHDGMSILRVGSIGERCYGPVLADVNGCYSINLDCRMYDSLLVAEQTATKAAFYFSDSGGAKPTKAILINCEGGGNDTFTLFANTANPINVSNLKGGNIRDGSEVEYI